MENKLETRQIEIFIDKVKESRLNQLDFDNIPFGRTFSDHMFLADYNNGEWKSPRIVPYGNLRLSPATSSIHYGQSIFEGMKAYLDQNKNPQLFRPLENFKRFNKSAERMCMPQISEDLFMGALENLIKLDKNWIPDRPGNTLYVRPYMFATDAFLGVRPSESYLFAVITGPVGSYYDAAKPLNLKVSTDYVRAFPGGTGFAKAAGNYAASLLPSQKALKDGYDQLIWLDGINRKYLEESGTMNLFVVIDGVLITSSLESGTVLNGVTRKSTIQLAKHLGIPVEVRKISIDEVVEAYENQKLDEVFGAGTAATLSHATTVTYKDLRMELPPVSERKIAPRILQILEDIKVSKTEDIFGWMHKI